MGDVSSAPDIRAWRRLAAMPWAMFRRLPWWGQVVGWVLGFWILPALWILARATGPVGVAGAATLALIGTVIVAPAIWSQDATDVAGISDANGLVQASAPDSTSMPSGWPSETSTTDPSPTPGRVSTPPPSPTASATSTSVLAPSIPGTAPARSTPAAVPGLPDGGEVTTVERIVDGDTLYLAGLGERARLIGIDTPETVAPNTPVQCFGPEATDRLTELVPPGTEVVITRDVEAIDRYDRPLVYLHRVADGLFVNEAMVADGYAQLLTVPPNVAHVEVFRRAQRSAREAGLGLWTAECGTDGEPFATQPPVPLADPTTGGGVVIARVEYDGPGRDVEHNTSEHVVLRNNGDTPVDVGGWSLTDEADHVITIPGGYVIPAGEQLRVHTGPGDNSDRAFHAGEGQAIWNNSGGDTATLRDASGGVVAQTSYSS